MVLYLSIAQFLLSSAIDLWMFLKITRIKLNINLKLGLTLVVITIGSIISIILDEYGGLLLANISEIIGFYLIYKKPDNKKQEGKKQDAKKDGKNKKLIHLACV